MYPKHFRPKANVYYSHVCHSVRKVASQLDVSKSTAFRWIHEGDNIDKARKVPIRNSIVRDMTGNVAKLIESNHFLTCMDIQRTLIETYSITISLTSVKRILKTIGVSYKLASRSREHQEINIEHPFVHDPDVYKGAIAIDESCFVSCDQQRRGWAKRGKCVPKYPPKTRNTISLLLSIDCQGVVAHQITKGTFNSQTFSRFIDGLPSHRTLIMDNVAFHKSKVVKDTAIQKTQRLVYTPPYCPWFNPVEHAFSVTKNTFRKERTTHPKVCFIESVERCLTSLTSLKCQAFFTNAEKVRNETLEAASR